MDKKEYGMSLLRSWPNVRSFLILHNYSWIKIFLQNQSRFYSHMVRRSIRSFCNELLSPLFERWQEVLNFILFDIKYLSYNRSEWCTRVKKGHTVLLQHTHTLKIEDSSLYNMFCNFFLLLFWFWWVLIPLLINGPR